MTTESSRRRGSRGVWRGPRVALTTVTFGLPLLFGGEAVAGGSVVDMVTLPSNELAMGASTLMRYDDAVDMTIHTTGLEPGHAYSVWWVIFNNPDACSDECNQDDFPEGAPGGEVGAEPPDPAVEVSVLWATGVIVGSDGTADFSAHLQVGNPPGMVSFGPGLVDPMNAEIHLPVRSHGRAMVGHVAEQISTTQGLCEITKPDPGSSKCLDVQVAYHMPF